jgi:hypothetical protein
LNISIPENEHGLIMFYLREIEETTNTIYLTVNGNNTLGIFNNCTNDNPNNYL